MISISDEARQLLQNNQKLLFKATVSLKDNTTLNLTGADVIADSVSFKNSCSPSSTFAIGSAIINTFSFTLANFDGRFDAYDFTEAQIIPYIGIPLQNTEWIQKGVYIVNKPTSIGDTIPLTCLDRMNKLEKPFNTVDWGAYASSISKITIGNALYRICQSCGVQAISYSFDFTDQYVNLDLEDKDNMSCLDAVSYLAQICGCFARFSRFGYLEFSWYQTGIWDSANVYDGGDFNYINDDTILDGGDFNYATQPEIIDGGNFTYGNYISLYAFSNFSVATEDITITGIRVSTEDSEVASGTDGYVLAISDNPIITKSHETSSTGTLSIGTICTHLYTKIGGMTFRPFSVSALVDITAEPSDPVRLLDKNGKLYFSYITSCGLSLGSYETFTCDAETVNEHNATDFSAITKAVAKARSESEKLVSSYDVAVQRMTECAMNSLGYFMTSTDEIDGSKITYLHDKPTLSASTTIFKITSSGFFVSRDGGATYVNGYNATTGQVVVNVLDVIGLSADWIKAGTIDAINISGSSISGGTIYGTNISGVTGSIGGFTIGNDNLHTGSSSNGVWISGTANHGCPKGEVTVGTHGKGLIRIGYEHNGRIGIVWEANDNEKYFVDLYEIGERL